MARPGVTGAAWPRQVAQNRARPHVLANEYLARSPANLAPPDDRHTGPGHDADVDVDAYIAGLLAVLPLSSARRDRPALILRSGRGRLSLRRSRGPCG